MINISHGVCDICIVENKIDTKLEQSTVILNINNKQIEFCDKHFKEFKDLINKYYKENFNK